jgi:hypothetical protein
MKMALLALAALVGAGLCHAQSEPGPLLLQQPTMSRTQIVFVYAGELWRVNRDGGAADVENHGVAPDVPMELDPKAWREGHDVQLEKAVAVALDELKRHPLPRPKAPMLPDYSRYAH